MNERMISNMISIRNISLSIILIAFLLLIFNSLTLAIDTVSASEKIESPVGEKLAGIGIGDSVPTVIKLLGQPEQKSVMNYDPEVNIQRYTYKSKGIELEFSKDKVSYITVTSPCKKETSGGIKIGDTADKVKKTYLLHYGPGDFIKVKDGDNLANKRVYCSSNDPDVGWTIAFMFDENSKVKRITIGYCRKLWA